MLTECNNNNNHDKIKGKENEYRTGYIGLCKKIDDVTVSSPRIGAKALSF